MPILDGKRLKIVSDGTSEGTKLLYPDGSAVPNVSSISFSISADSKSGLCECTIKLAGVVVDVDVDGSSVNHVS